MSEAKITRAQVDLLRQSIARPTDDPQRRDRVFIVGWPERSIAALVAAGLIELRPLYSEAFRDAARRDVIEATADARALLDESDWRGAFVALSNALTKQAIVDERAHYVTEAGKALALRDVR